MVAYFFVSHWSKRYRPVRRAWFWSRSRKKYWIKGASPVGTLRTSSRSATTVTLTACLCS